MSRHSAALLTAAAVVWGLLILGAPFALHAGTAVRPASLLYLASARICHQRPERSFILSGAQMPVCARCSGLYLSGAAGALVAWRRRIGPVAGRPYLLIAAALPTALTFFLEVVGLIRFSNAARAIAAVPLGACAGWLFVRMLRYDARLDGLKNADS